MSASGKRTSVSTAAIGGVLDPATKKLADSMDAAAASTDKASKASEKSAAEGEKQTERIRESARATVSGVASGAISALGQAGAGSTDAAYGAVGGLQSALPALGSTLGAGAGPLGSIVGNLLGQAGSAGIERLVAQERNAREQAIAQTSAAFAPAAAQGVVITKEEYREVFTQAFRIALAEQQNKADARAASQGGF